MVQIKFYCQTLDCPVCGYDEVYSWHISAEWIRCRECGELIPTGEVDRQDLAPEYKVQYNRDKVLPDGPIKGVLARLMGGVNAIVGPVCRWIIRRCEK